MPDVNSYLASHDNSVTVGQKQTYKKNPPKQGFNGTTNKLSQLISAWPVPFQPRWQAREYNHP